MSDLNDKEYFLRIFSFISSQIDSFDDDGMAYALTNLAMKASENVCVARAAETHSNPLEAIGIVMRETGAIFEHYVASEIRLSLNGDRVITEDLCIDHDDILNTLKEGK